MTGRKILLLLISMIILGTPAFAEKIPMFDGGVIGDPTLADLTYEYEEMTFITGAPIKLVGTVVVPEIPVGLDTYELAYTFTLANTAANATVARTATYNVVKTENTDLRQTKLDITLSELTEAITIGGTTYTLGSYSFNKAILEDNTAAVNYYSGNIIAKRKYYIGGGGTNVDNNGIIELETTSDTLVGYNHYWGSSETQVLNTTFTQTDSTTNWAGSVLLEMSATQKKRFQYIPTDPQNISFRGNYITTTNEENILQYNYNMPTTTGGINDAVRVAGQSDMRLDKITDTDSMISPKITDIGGHWAMDTIYLLTSLEVLDTDVSVFGPNQPVSRLEFAKMVSKAISNTQPFTQTQLIRRDRNTDKQNLFLDVDITDPDLAYIEFAKEKRIMAGEGDFFMPDRTLRRSEAITILTNTLGLTHLAPAPPYTTSYVDDADIPNWAKDGIYMANEIGLVQGYQDGTIKPNNLVTRAEASAMIEQFIYHMKDNITYDYREQILNNR